MTPAGLPVETRPLATPSPSCPSPARQRTVTVWRIQGWMQHWYFSVPFSSKVCCLVWPECTIVLSKPAASAHSGATVVFP